MNLEEIEVPGEYFSGDIAAVRQYKGRAFTASRSSQTLQCT